MSHGYNDSSLYLFFLVYKVRGVGFVIPDPEFHDPRAPEPSHLSTARHGGLGCLAVPPLGRDCWPSAFCRAFAAERSVLCKEGIMA